MTKKFKYSAALCVIVLTFVSGVLVGGRWLLPIKIEIKRLLHKESEAKVSPKAQPSLDYAYDWENDPIGSAFFGKVPPMLETVFKEYELRREYKKDNFPLSKADHSEFRKKIINTMLSSMTGRGGEGSRWLVRSPYDKNKVSGLFRTEFVSSVKVKGRNIDLYNIYIKDTGDIVPAAICMPSKIPAPAVVAFSGHTHFGLRELFVDLESYQRGIAWRLCEAGFVTAAVEKIDSGVSSVLFQKKGERWRGDVWADDEDRISTMLLGMDDYLIPARQLMVNIALVEFVAGMRTVDKSRIGAVGISLGGWLTLQTALLNDRIKAVANFGGMWAYLDPYTKTIDHPDLVGINDFSQLFPGIWRYGDQARYIYAAAPIPMITGYGRRDTPYINFREYFYPGILRQYEVLGKPDDIEVVVHEGGHVLPDQEVIKFFKSRLMNK